MRVFPRPKEKGRRRTLSSVGKVGVQDAIDDYIKLVNLGRLEEVSRRVAGNDPPGIFE